MHNPGTGNCTAQLITDRVFEYVASTRHRKGKIEDPDGRTKVACKHNKRMEISFQNRKEIQRGNKEINSAWLRSWYPFPKSHGKPLYSMSTPVRAILLQPEQGLPHAMNPRSQHSKTLPWRRTVANTGNLGPAMGCCRSESKLKSIEKFLTSANSIPWVCLGRISTSEPILEHEAICSSQVEHEIGW